MVPNGAGAAPIGELKPGRPRRTGTFRGKGMCTAAGYWAAIASQAISPALQTDIARTAQTLPSAAGRRGFSLTGVPRPIESRYAPGPLAEWILKTGIYLEF
ncbi:MAG: hypothetical protein D6814_18010 [Calditrichaeota bacterium]|nr:MAG: hypothetical protein D6814_18010 [Calditrichota bacterium]